MKHMRQLISVALAWTVLLCCAPISPAAAAAWYDEAAAYAVENGLMDAAGGDRGPPDDRCGALARGGAAGGVAGR